MAYMGFIGFRAGEIIVVYNNYHSIQSTGSGRTSTLSMNKIMFKQGICRVGLMRRTNVESWISGLGLI